MSITKNTLTLAIAGAGVAALLLGAVMTNGTHQLRVHPRHDAARDL